MSTNEQPSAGSSRSSSSNLGVPVAVVIAGALIALAIYFGDGKTSSKTVSTSPTSTPTVAVQKPTQPAIGDIRAVDAAKDHVRGAANAKVTIIEYSDTECPFCKRFQETMKQVMQEFPNDVRWVYRHFPLDQLHQKSRKEAVATECAGEQGKFWEMLDKIYEVTPTNDGLDPAKLPVLAKEVGVANIQQFETCLSSGKYDQRVADDVADAQKAGGRGTPYSIIIAPDGTKSPIGGALPFEGIKASIQQVLDKK